MVASFSFPSFLSLWYVKDGEDDTAIMSEDYDYGP